MFKLKCVSIVYVLKILNQRRSIALFLPYYYSEFQVWIYKIICTRITYLSEIIAVTTIYCLQATFEQVQSTTKET